MDTDTMNTIKREEKGFKDWQNKQVKRILGIQNPTRRQLAWHEVFPRLEATEDLSYLAGNVY